MPSMAMMSAPPRAWRASSSFDLYCSSSTPEGWKVTCAVLPSFFIFSTNLGITQSVIHLAPSEFLPPAIALDVIVKLNSLALAFLTGLVLTFPPPHAAARAATATAAVNVVSARLRICASVGHGPEVTGPTIGPPWHGALPGSRVSEPLAANVTDLSTGRQ